MEITEIKHIRINGEGRILPTNYWLNMENGLIEKSINLEIENLNFHINIRNEENVVYICNQSDLSILLEKLDMPYIDLKEIRLKVIHTKKWGEKLIYDKGAKSICFGCYYFNHKNGYYMIFFNTDGTKEIESIYIHGVWRCNYLVQ
jgi:hypothetical protein